MAISNSFCFSYFWIYNCFKSRFCGSTIYLYNFLVKSILGISAFYHDSAASILINGKIIAAAQEESIDGLHTWMESIRTFPKPVIAAVEGAAAGAGLSLALSCDFIVAADNANFVMAYSNVGLSPDGGGSWAIARHLPRATAMNMLMAAQPMRTGALHALGVVSHAAPPGQALQTALDLAANLNTRAPNVLASLKELVNEAADNSLSTHLQAEKKHFIKNLYHPNGGEGISAFLEKRRATYK